VTHALPRRVTLQQVTRPSPCASLILLPFSSLQPCDAPSREETARRLAPLLFNEDGTPNKMWGRTQAQAGKCTAKPSECLIRALCRWMPFAKKKFLNKTL
jgi:hypothetical protein